MEFIDIETVKKIAETNGESFDEAAEIARREQIERVYPEAGVIPVQVVESTHDPDVESSSEADDDAVKHHEDGSKTIRCGSLVMSIPDQRGVNGWMNQPVFSHRQDAAAWQTRD
jgi:hypothetical protein